MRVGLFIVWRLFSEMIVVSKWEINLKITNPTGKSHQSSPGQREKEDEMTSFLDSHQSAAAVNKKLRFETSHEPILVIL